VLRSEGCFEGWFFAVWRGRGSLFRCRGGEEEEEIGEGRQRGDILTFIDGIPIFVCESDDNFIGEVDTSLYEDPDLNLSAIPLVKSPIKISTSSHCFVF
jgi:hypothetical protein